MTRRVLVEPGQPTDESSGGQPAGRLDPWEEEGAPVFEFSPEKRRFLEETAEAVAGLMD